MSKSIATQVSEDIMVRLMSSGLNPEEGIVVLLQTAATGFYADGMHREDALYIFEQLLDRVYLSLSEGEANESQNR
jgi:hypothetical protein